MFHRSKVSRSILALMCAMSFLKPLQRLALFHDNAVAL
jgi:hypothetical protein